MSYYCYILQCIDGSFYTGWTTDLERRIYQHNQGIGSHYTRSRRPVHLVYSQVMPDRSSAMRRESSIKHLPRSEKQRLIENYEKTCSK